MTNKRDWRTSEQRHPCRYFPLGKFLFVGTPVNGEVDGGFIGCGIVAKTRRDVVFSAWKVRDSAKKLSF